MLFSEPIKFIFRGKLLPGFIAKIDTDTTVKIDSTNETVNIKEDLIPMIETAVEDIIEEFKD